MVCRVCGLEMELLETLKDKERNTVTLYTKKYYGERRDIKLFKCYNCTHMQIEYSFNPDYYDGYNLVAEPTEESEHGRFSPYVLSYYREKLSQLKTYAKSHKSVLDIGCGPGIVMELEKDYFEEPLGVEPSKGEAKIAMQLGLNVINDYFSSALNLRTGFFSAFISTQVFEHITSIKESLLYAYDLLEVGGGRISRSTKWTKSIYRKVLL